MTAQREPVPRQFKVPIVEFGLLGVVIAAFLLARFGYDFKRAIQEFPRRHLEATRTINEVYSYYHEHRKWPGLEQFGSAGLAPLPPEWDYLVDDVGRS